MKLVLGPETVPRMLLAPLRGLGAIDPAKQAWNTPAYQECVGVRIQECGQKYAYGSSEQRACIDTAQGACIAEAAAGSRTKWLLIGLGFGAVTMTLLWYRSSR